MKSIIFQYPTLLVNRLRPVGSEIKEHRLVAVANKGFRVLLEREAARAFRALMDAIDGWSGIVPASGHRPRSEQAALYARSLRENGPDFTDKFVALPGHSEHETGLAIDVALWIEDIDLYCPKFPQEGICQAFRESAPAFGFIERYPKGKEAVTGIACEPWHFRFIGREHAQSVSQSGLAYEEYLLSIGAIEEIGKLLP